MNIGHSGKSRYLSNLIFEIEEPMMKKGKMDRRMKGHHYFEFYVEFSTLNRLKFDEVRRWCYSTFGPSSEFDIWFDYPSEERANWCWINDDYRCKLLFKSSKEYNWFQLKYT